jgi:hypothetical protein
VFGPGIFWSGLSLNPFWFGSPAFADVFVGCEAFRVFRS